MAQLMSKNLFVGRKRERRLLLDLLEKKVASLVVIKGRRRIGKSRLVEEFAKDKPYYVFSGLPPNEYTTAQSQRDDFANQLSIQTGLPEIRADDWSKLFLLFADKIKTGRAIILFDEISWMGSKDSTFLGKLKNAWDLHFKKNPNLILILCGSVSVWIENNIISSTGFFGRIALKITLGELSLSECNELIQKIGFNRSVTEKFHLLSITGGIPWYIELINPKYSAEENIKRLCFEKDGILVDEFKFIFHDLFGRRGEICKKIVEFLAKGPAEYADIVTALDYHNSGSLSEYLNDLSISGFVRRDFTWGLKSGKDSRLSQFRLSDNYVRFYLKYILPRLNKINKNQFSRFSLSSLMNWDSIAGLQFENMVLNNRKEIHALLGLKDDEILADNPYFQNKTTKQQGCQIDYLIQTRYNTLFVCEIKLLKNQADLSIIQDMKEKIAKLAIPKGYACLPVLIHVNGVSESLVDAGWFYKIIEFSQVLEFSERH